MSMNILNDISSVYLEQIAFQEAKVDKLKPEHERASARDARYDNPDGALELGGGVRRARRIAHRERDELNKDAKDIRRGKLGGPQFQGKTGAERIAIVKKAKGMKEALDPVGQEDADIDNDGDTDKTDKYLHKRRKAIGNAIAKKKGMKEGFSNWRQDLAEVMTDAVADSENDVKIKEKKVNNKVKINPQLGEAIEEIGGVILEMNEIELQEKAESEQQQKLFGLALSVKRGTTPRSEVSDAVLKIVDTMSEKKIRDFAKTKHEGIPKKVKEEMQPTTPQQLSAQRKLTMAQKELSVANQAALRMKKKDMQQAQEEFVSEEDYDRMKDRHLERGGMGARSSTSPAKQSTTKLQTDAERKASMEKQRETAKKALDMVRASIVAKHGKGSLM